MRMLFTHLCLGSNGFSLKEDLAADQASAGYPNFKHWYICIQAGECEDAFDCNEWNPCCSLAGYCGTEASGHCSGAVTIGGGGNCLFCLYGVSICVHTIESSNKLGGIEEFNLIIQASLLTVTLLEQ